MFYLILSRDFLECLGGAPLWIPDKHGEESFCFVFVLFTFSSCSSYAKGWGWVVGREIGWCCNFFFFCIYSATAPFRSLTAAVVSLRVRDRRARRATGAQDIAEFVDTPQKVVCTSACRFIHREHGVCYVRCGAGHARCPPPRDCCDSLFSRRCFCLIVPDNSSVVAALRICLREIMLPAVDDAVACNALRHCCFCSSDARVYDV